MPQFLLIEDFVFDVKHIYAIVARRKESANSFIEELDLYLDHTPHSGSDNKAMISQSFRGNPGNTSPERAWTQLTQSESLPEGWVRFERCILRTDAICQIRVLRGFDGKIIAATVKMKLEKLEQPVEIEVDADSARELYSWAEKNNIKSK